MTYHLHGETTKQLKQRNKADVSRNHGQKMCSYFVAIYTIHHVCNKLKKRGNMLFIIEIFGVLFNFDSFLAQRKKLELKLVVSLQFRLQ